MVNALNVTPVGPGAPVGGSSGGDTVNVFGDFTQTSLSFNTITVNGGRGNDSVDISGLTSDHRLVFNTGGGADQFIGESRPQDIVNSGNGSGGSGPVNPAPLHAIRSHLEDLLDDHGRFSFREGRHFLESPSDYPFF